MSHGCEFVCHQPGALASTKFHPSAPIFASTCSSTKPSPMEQYQGQKAQARENAR